MLRHRDNHRFSQFGVRDYRGNALCAVLWSLPVHPVCLRPVTFTSDYRLSRTSSVDARKTISGEYGAGFIVIGGNDGFTPPPLCSIRLCASSVYTVVSHRGEADWRTHACMHARTHACTKARTRALAPFHICLGFKTGKIMCPLLFARKVPADRVYSLLENFTFSSLPFIDTVRFTDSRLKGSSAFLGHAGNPSITISSRETKGGRRSKVTLSVFPKSLT